MSSVYNCKSETDPRIRLMRNQGSYELLVRGLMDLPNKPAIINVQ
jgi:hypothetical protein